LAASNAYDEEVVTPIAVLDMGEEERYHGQQEQQDLRTMSIEEYEVQEKEC